MKARAIKESTKFKVITPLLVADLSWTELLERTGLSKDSLAAVLGDLTKSGEVGYSLGRSEEGKKPAVAYSLPEEVKRKYGNIVSVLERINYIEQLSRRIANKAREEYAENAANLETIANRYYDLASKASLAILETAMEWEPKGAPLDEAVAAEAVSAARRIILMSDFPKNVARGLRDDLRSDRDRLLGLLEKAAGVSKKKKTRKENRPTD